MDSNSEMYKLKSYYETSAVIDTPDCMYKLKGMYGNNLDKTPIPDVLELEKRQESILQRLEVLKQEVDQLSEKQKSASQQPLATNGVIQDLVVNASPNNPPLSLVVLKNILAEQHSVLTSSFVHSSAGSVPDCLRSLFSRNGSIANRGEYQLALTLIWKDEKYGTSMMISPNIQTAVHGEANMARYISRLISPAYDEGDVARATEIDTWLDQATQLLQGSNKERAAVVRTLNAQLGKNSWVVGSQMSLADIVLWSAIQQNKMTQSVPGNIRKWLDACNKKQSFATALQIASAL